MQTLRDNLKRIVKETIDQNKEDQDYEELYKETLKQLVIYKTLAAYREREYDMEHTIVIILTVVILIETIAIGFLV
jgi:hypothetical protein